MHYSQTIEEGFVIQSLEEVSFDVVYEAHHEAFNEYPFRWTREELAQMLHRRSYSPVLSFGAFEGDRLVSFTLNGIGSFRGKSTVYDASTGTIATHRKKGLSTAIFKVAIPILRAQGVEQYVLEVLKGNTDALSVYKSIGFEITRSFTSFRVQTSDWSLPDINPAAGIRLQEIDLTWQPRLQSLCSFHHSWQNDFPAIRNSRDSILILGAFDRQELIGYGIIEYLSGDIPQLVVSEPYRRLGIGSWLLAEVSRRNRASILKFVNAEESLTALTRFFKAHAIPLVAEQFEMVLVFRD